MKSFEDIIGHDEITKDLNRMIKEDRLNHGLLFDGINGIGKKFTAQRLAKALLCENKTACGDCKACKLFDARSQPDYLFVQAEDLKIKKAKIKEIIDFLQIKPFDSTYKVVIVDDFDLATIEAQNTFLKTLEEPPIYAKIILLSENSDRLLDTVRSRLKIYKFFPIAKVYLVEYLMDTYNMPEDQASFLADYSGGSIGKAIKYIKDEDFKLERKLSIEIFDKAIKGHRKFVLDNISFFSKENIDEVINIYVTWLRDLLIYKETKSKLYLYNKDYANLISSQMFLSEDNIGSISDFLIKTKEDLSYNIAVEFVMEVFLINVMEECSA